MTVRRRGLGRCAAGIAVAVLACAVGAQSAKPGAPSARTAAAAKADAAAKNAAAYKARFASLCAACHGSNGRSELAGTPVLAGQPGLYAITQLFLFREGRRGNEAMIAVAKTMTDDDMRGFSDVIDALPAVPAPSAAAAPDPARMAKGRELAREHKCVFCHGDNLGGGQQVPRIGGQHEDYLRDSLRGFKTGKRPGYTRAMTEALSQVPIGDLDILAYYAARVPVVAAAPVTAAASAPRMSAPARR